eukprot:UN03706
MSSLLAKALNDNIDSFNDDYEETDNRTITNPELSAETGFLNKLLQRRENTQTSSLSTDTTNNNNNNNSKSTTKLTTLSATELATTTAHELSTAADDVAKSITNFFQRQTSSLTGQDSNNNHPIVPITSSSTTTQLTDTASSRKQSNNKTSILSWFGWCFGKVKSFAIITSVSLLCYCILLSLLQDKLIYLYPTYNKNYANFLLRRYKAHPLKQQNNNNNNNNNQQSSTKSITQSPTSTATTTSIPPIYQHNTRKILAISYSYPEIVNRQRYHHQHQQESINNNTNIFNDIPIISLDTKTQFNYDTIITNNLKLGRIDSDINLDTNNNDNNNNTTTTTTPSSYWSYLSTLWNYIPIIPNLVSSITPTVLSSYLTQQQQFDSISKNNNNLPLFDYNLTPDYTINTLTPFLQSFLQPNHNNNNDIHKSQQQNNNDDSNNKNNTKLKRHSKFYTNIEYNQSTKQPYDNDNVLFTTNDT